jgi:hypothetical protein
VQSSPNTGAFVFALGVLFTGAAGAQEIQRPAGGAQNAQYDGADWHLKGSGVVCCPCRVPCPCRTNGRASYGHCEATLYLEVKDGHYGPVDLSGLHLVDTGGACSMTYQSLSALYFDEKDTQEQQMAFMKVIASFFPNKAIRFRYVRAVPIRANLSADHLFYINIPEILDMEVDRNWGQPTSPFLFTAAVDYFSNALQYAQNLRYQLHDPAAQLNFDYSRRQANYRIVDIGSEQYRLKTMLIQYEDGKGWFNQSQLELIKAQGIPLPDQSAVRKMADSLRNR